MTVHDLLVQVQASGAKLRVDGDDLVLTAAQPLSNDLVLQLRHLKPEIIKELVSPDPADAWEWIEERAAILEMDGELDRASAHHHAFMLWFRRFVDQKN
jgi:hypothetical protein